MQYPKKLGIGIVMIVPGFVFGGLVWSLFGSWLPVIILEIMMVFIYTSIISGKFSRVAQKT